MTLENFNEVGPIEVPQEVKDNAKPLEEKMEEPDTSTSTPTYALAGVALILFGGSILLYRRKSAA